MWDAIDEQELREWLGDIRGETSTQSKCLFGKLKEMTKSNRNSFAVKEVN